MNIFQALLFPKQNWEQLKTKLGKTVYVIMIIVYILSIIALITIVIISKYYDYPYIDLLNYEKPSHTLWEKDPNAINQNTPEAFCRVSSELTSELTTQDFAVLTTLPRLYGVNNEGKCYIKPRFRGVFNATMKYIFGEDYHTKGIHIYCWTQTNDPYLVLTSREMLESRVNSLTSEGKTISYINQGDTFYSPKNYFTKELCSDNKANFECQELKTCLSNSNDADESACQKQWNVYSDAYWKDFSEDYIPNLRGLEPYELQIDKKFMFQPRLKDQDGNEYTSIHYVIGGGIENRWGYALLLENFARTNIPIIFQSLIPFYSIVFEWFRDLFTFFSECSLGFIYVETLAQEEMINFVELINRFNISHHEVFLVGHSISATTIKEFSYISNISGITFESSLGLGYSKYRVSDLYHPDERGLNNIANIYSDGVILTGQDPDFKLNGELPSNFINPNVYDTACLTYATCGYNDKYLNYCKQVLNQHGDDPIAKFNEILDAYLNR